MKYSEFLHSKEIRALPCGFESKVAIATKLFDFQQFAVRWALKRGRAALFEDCGLGKSFQQLEWAYHVHLKTNKPVVIFTPLAVASQLKSEAQKLGIRCEVKVCGEQSDVIDGINITNYEKLDKFESVSFGGIVLDESSILKAMDGRTKNLLIQFGQPIPYRLCCTATPSPNDLIELGNHAEFLGIMTAKAMRGCFFKQADGNGSTVHDWRLKGHAEKPFYKWLASWALAIRKPSDLGFSDEGFVLPQLNFEQIAIASAPQEGALFASEATSLTEQRKVRKDTLEERIAIAADLVAQNPDDSHIIWCELNDESQSLAKAISGARELTGSQSAEQKERILEGFGKGEFNVLISKPSIAGFGLNWQHCNRVIFSGVSHSYEQQYQAIRRCYRFGQKRDVTVTYIVAESEGRVVRNVKRKEQQTAEMMERLIEEMSQEIIATEIEPVTPYATAVEKGRGWTLYKGDCIEQLANIADESIGLTVTSPPFPQMYSYQDSPRDLGNSLDSDSLVEHLGFLVQELLRVTIPGRLCAFHITQEPIFKHQQGFIGLSDFRGKLISEFVKKGWIYFTEVTIDKDPQIKAARTKESTLLFKTLSSDSTMSRPCMTDYLIVFKKPGDNPEPVKSGTHPRWNPNGGWITPEEWIEYARGVWYGIKESDVLNTEIAKDSKDERHICPLQLEVISRAVKLWSNPGDTILDPFNGIGSTGYKALQLHRKYAGIELKESYFNTAVKNLRRIEDAGQQLDIFSAMELA